MAAADRTNADLRRQLSVNSTLPQISRDLQGGDNPIPLSPQWLLPKPGENKPGIATGDSHSSSYPNSANRGDVMNKASGEGEEFVDVEKKRDVFRPPLIDAETGRRDHWRDEERDSNSTVRRDRWREGDKELADTRKIERWTGEARRAPSERWSDLGNRENNYDQRRESKWNTRWGPDDKESESWREKWSDSSKDEGSRDKGMPPSSNHAKEMEREADHYPRSWRSNSSQIRGRGEPPHQPTLMPNKQAPMFGYGRGRGECSSSFSAGRGRISSSSSTVNNSSHYYHSGTPSDKFEGVRGDPSTLRYSRTKMLDVYRMTDVRSYRKPYDGFTEVPSLTQAELLEPLALSTPTPEELVIRKGIDKGDIVSSGAPQVSKDGSVGRNSSDVAQSRRPRIGSREDLPPGMDDYKEESNHSSKGDHVNQSESQAFDRHVYSHGPALKADSSQTLQSYEDSKFNGEESIPHRKADEMVNRDGIMQENCSAHPSGPWRSQSLVDRSHGSSHDWRDFPSEARSRMSDMGWLHSQKDQDSEWENNASTSPSLYKDGVNWLGREGLHRQSSEVMDRGRETIIMPVQEDAFTSRDKAAVRNVMPPISPDDLSLYYKDPQGKIQGPFSGSDLIGWFEAGYFGIDLQVRMVNASPDTPFSALGDVMPHLRMKARPPPGFGAPKQIDVEMTSRAKLSGIGNLHAGMNELDLTDNEQKNSNESVTEAENRFLESLMSPLDARGFSEGLQGYVGNSSGGLPPIRAESASDVNYLLSQRMALERQRSLPNPLQYWPGRDATSMIPNAEIVPDSPLPHSKLLPVKPESPLQISHSPHHVDLMSMLQGVADKTASPAVNNGVNTWSNFPDVRSLGNTAQGGFDIHQDKVDLHHKKHFAPQVGYGYQPQRLQPQHQPPLSHLMTQPGDLHSSILSLEKLLSSGLSQDPQMLNLLQQQYMLSQLKLPSQAPVPTQLALLDKLLMLKRQQQQEQQLLLQQQQQQLLSQVLSEQQSHQHFGETSHGQLPASAPGGNSPLDHLMLRELHESFQIKSQMPQNVPSSRDTCAVENSAQDEHTTKFGNLPSQESQNANYTVSSEALPLHLPHHFFGTASLPKGWDGTPSQHIDDVQNSAALPKPAPEVMENSFNELPVLHKQGQVENSLVAVAQLCQEHVPRIIPKTDETIGSCPTEVTAGKDLTVVISVSSDNTDISIPVSEKTNNAKASSASNPEELQVQGEQRNADLSTAKDVKKTGHDSKKASEKKSRKAKNSKAQSSSDLGKGASKSISSQHPKKDSEIEGINLGDTKSDAREEAGEAIYDTSPEKARAEPSLTSMIENLDFQKLQNCSVGNVLETVEGKDEPSEEFAACDYIQTPSSHRAWRSAPGLKPKSLVEIQQEEQRRTRTEMVASEVTVSVHPASSSSLTPWAGLVANSEPKTSRETHQDMGSAKLVLGDTTSTLNLRSKKSQLHDLLAEEVLAKTTERVAEAPANTEKGSVVSSVPSVTTQMDVSNVDNDDFIEAKDTKKSRKRATKAKGMGAKASPSVASVDALASPVPIEKAKSSRQIQQEKEVLPVLPSGPSLGDFVLWKGDQTNAAPAPAWSTDAGKLSKPTSLRDIQKEQEKKMPSVQHEIQIPVAPKVQSNRSTRGSSSVSSWHLSGTSPSKTASPIQISSVASAHSRSKTEDDLFWGPLDQSKQEAKQLDFPSLANTSSASRGIPGKGSPGASFSRQKSYGSRTAEYSLSSSPASVSAQSFSKERKEALTKHTEAMDFRDWCESESVRLIGTKDTSFLEFCLKQSTSEAEMLLVENIGSFDPNHDFIDKFLKYKELLSADVIEIAFQARSERKEVGFGVEDVNTNSLGGGEDYDPDMATNPEGSAKSGKKKGKKGKKVSSSVLGFNVVSTRIMMGEIQSVED